MLDDRTTYAPLQLFEYDHKPGHYCLMLSDMHMDGTFEVFEANGAYGNGYAWEGVAKQAIRAHAPELDGRLDFDPEAGTFVAYGEDLVALRRLGALLHGAFHDHDALATLIRDADPDEMD